jgi:hypothetical protein
MAVSRRRLILDHPLTGLLPAVVNRYPALPSTRDTASMISRASGGR